MATCKNCLHIDVCEAYRLIGNIEIAEACKNFKDRDKYVERKHEKWKNGRCTGCGAKEVIGRIWYRMLDDGLKTEIERVKTEFCQHCGAKMDLK